MARRGTAAAVCRGTAASRNARDAARHAAASPADTACRAARLAVADRAGRFDASLRSSLNDRGGGGGVAAAVCRGPAASRNARDAGRHAAATIAEAACRSARLAVEDGRGARSAAGRFDSSLRSSLNDRDAGRGAARRVAAAVCRGPVASRNARDAARHAAASPRAHGVSVSAPCSCGQARRAAARFDSLRSCSTTGTRSGPVVERAQRVETRPRQRIGGVCQMRSM